jgi:serine/threonine-protein kinase
MTEPTSDRVKELFDQAVVLPVAQRAAFLEAACASDAALRAEVESLLACDTGFSDTSLEGLLKSPLVRAPEPAAWPADSPERAGRVQLLGEIARGGMGAVLRGHDPELQRELAVKVILLAHRDHPDLLRRFVGEARLAAQLQHPAIVPVYDLGQLADGRPFFTMKLIQGRTLAQLLAERADPGQDLPRLLRYFEAVCQAVGYAHARGVIHRDLKPINVMVGAFGEVQVMDWGLAKRLQDGPEGEPEPTALSPALASSTPLPSALTHPGAVVGTPGYLAPEQAGGLAGDQRSDVFGLGAILCEILTGAPPFRGGGLLSLVQQARAGDLSSAMRDLDHCGADPELVHLAKDCLAVDPACRPADGAVVAARLAAYLAGVQERLRRSELGQARAEARAEGERSRRRLAVGLAVAVLAVVVLGGGTLLLLQGHRAEQAREQARRQQAAESALARAADLQQQGRWAEALAVLEQARQRLEASDEQVRQEIQRALAEVELVGRLEKVRLGAATVTGRFFARARADRDYESEFRAAGLGGPDDPVEAVAERVRASGVRAVLVAALDAWAGITVDRRRQDWALAVARSADEGDDWGRRLRASWADPAALEVLARDAPIARLSPQLLTTLAAALGNGREALPLLRKAQLQYPGDFWVNFSLALMLAEEGQHAEAARFYQAALAARPDTPAVLLNLGLALKDQNRLNDACDCFRRAIALDPGFAYAHANLGNALKDKGQLDEAITCFRKAVEIEAKDPMLHYDLGLALKDRGKLDQAIECYRKAIEIDSKHAMFHNDLGNALKDKGQLDEAIKCYYKALKIDANDPMFHCNLGLALKDRGKPDQAIECYRKAIELDPKHAKAYTGLGLALKTRGKVDEAIECYRKAIELDPKDAFAHNNLGSALKAKKKVDEAIECYHKAIELDPKFAAAHYNLGNALRAKGRLAEAIACFRKAIAINPNYPEAHCNLGDALMQRGDFAEAIACCRKAIEIDPNLPEAHCNLGEALMHRGDFAEALGAFRRGHELGSKRGDWKHPSDKWVRDCERLIEREKKLLEVLAGTSKPADARERIEWARLCVHTRRFVAAARLSREAFEAEQELANDLAAGHRYRAATAAALAGIGQGRDAGKLTGEARAALRRQALAWLKADLGAWRRHKDGSQRERALRSWRADKALAGVRDKEGLAKLSPAERAAWAELWAEVEKLLKRSP